MKKKGFTLVELLVVIAIIALLMGILMPALSRVRQIAFRMTCGTNLAGIGKAMMIYAGDYEEQYPKAGWRGTTWGKTLNYAQPTRELAFGLPTATTSATVSSSLYLLVKFAEVTPKAFLCKGASGVTEFKETAMDISQYWDFGGNPWNSCSYTYHMPYNIGTIANPYALNAASDPSLPVAADFNPWIDSPAAVARTTTEFGSYDPAGNADLQKLGNSFAHQGDGQNVMYMDTHVEFESRPTRGVEEDNIYTVWSAATYTTSNVTLIIKKGMLPVPIQMSKNRNDSELVHDSKLTAGTTTTVVR